ncbi:MAG: SHOCT domain-containing protein [Pseudomonadales bacterium]
MSMFRGIQTLQRPACVAVLLGLLAACAGREPDPVPARLPGDDQKSCEEIRIEQASINAEVARLQHDENKTGKNVALGAAGLVTLGISWLWMDFSKAERVEIDAYRSRFLALERLAIQHGCAESPWAREDAANAAALTPEERLRRLEALHAQGLISDTEYETLRQSILGTL